MPYIGKEPVAGNFVLLDSITTSATATYALTKDSVAYSPESARNMIVSLNGVTQAPESAFTVSGSNITFSSALTSSDVIDYILVLGDVLSVGTPSDGTVGTSQMSYPLGNFSSTGIDDNATSTAITIDSSENVGIGTTSPDRLIHVSGGSGSVLAGKFETASTSGSMIVFKDADTTTNDLQVRIGSDANDLVQYAGGSERLRINSSGNVGIGTTSPATTMHLSSASTNIRLEDSDTNAYGQIGVDNAGSLYLQADNGNGQASSNMYMYVDGSERMRIDSSGNVGIGTTSPSKRLHINTATNGGILLEDSTNSITGIFYSSGSNSLAFGSTSNHPVKFFTNNSERMRIDSSGRVFIGKTSDNDNTAGHTLHSSGLVVHTRDQSFTTIFNRTTDDGDIVQFKKDGVISGRIGTALGPVLYAVFNDTTSNNVAALKGASSAILPSTNAGADKDGTMTLGSSGARFNNLYLSGGVYLGGTGSANHLDDYEEGTFTAYLGFSGGDTGSLNYTNQTFAYTKIGRVVNFSGFLTWNANNFTASSGRLYLRGLPFAIISGGSYRGGANINYANSPWTTITVYQQTFRSEDGTTDMTFNFSDATDGSIDSEITTHSRITSSGNFMVSGTYMTS